ncbi:MAG: pseudouridine synthase [Sphingobacteriales bacterium]|nr:MAG: pseudouridine synthase [Sphingobacteriales bacterium]
MKKPDRKRIPLNRPRPSNDGAGEGRAYSSNYGDGEKPFRKRSEPSDFPQDRRSEGDRGGFKKPYGTRSSEGGGGFKKPYSGRPTDGDRPDRKPYESRGEGGGGDRPFRKPFVRREDGDRKPFNREEGGERKSFGDRKPFNREEGGERKSFGDRKPFNREEGGERKSFGNRKPFGDRSDRKPFNKEEGGERKSFGDRKPYGERSSSGERKSFGDRPDRKPFNREEGGERKSFGDRKPFNREEGGERKSFGDRKPFNREEGGERKSFGNRKPFGDRPDRKPFNAEEGGERKSFGDRKPYGDRKPFNREGGDEKRSFGTRDDRPSFRNDGDPKPFNRSADGGNRPYGERPGRDTDRHEGREESRPRRRAKDYEDDELAPKKISISTTGMTLNKYLAHSGICGRREAGELVKSGKVHVNNESVTTPGYRIQEGDSVTFEGRVVKPEPAKAYVLLNKPKGFITTTEDEADRRTVMELVQGVEAERLYPVGRLDRNTTGVLLLTNDGDLAQRLTHPKYQCKKIYQVTLDKDLTKADFDQIEAGLTLEDGEIKADAVSYLESKQEIGIEIHSGRNRIVRRIFEHLGYSVEKLDRVMFAGLTKKNVPRGKYRLLTPKEVILLKHFKS